MARRMLKHSMLAAPLLSMFVPHAWAQETPTAEIPENRPAQTASQVIYRGYNAGGLFLINEIAENVNFKLAVLKQSRGRLYLTLPQSKQPAQRLEREAGNDQLETREQLAAQIRNVDIAELASCDFAVFHFEGAELDAGTVVEFVIAKMLGMPTVVIRTDVRRQGEIGPDYAITEQTKNLLLAKSKFEEFDRLLERYSSLKVTDRFAVKHKSTMLEYLYSSRPVLIEMITEGEAILSATESQDIDGLSRASINLQWQNILQMEGENALISTTNYRLSTWEPVLWLNLCQVAANKTQIDFNEAVIGVIVG